MVTVPSLVDEPPLDQYVATGGQTDFNFTYMIFDTSDIQVYVNGTLKTETTDYIVKQSDGSAIVPATDLPMDGGKVVFNAGLTVNDSVSLARSVPINRLTGYSSAGAFRADVLNEELTRMVAIMQQLRRDLDRAIRLNVYDSEGGTLILPSERANTFIAFDADGNLITSSGTVGETPITVSTFAETLLDDTTAAAARATLGAQQDVITTRGDIVRGSSTAVAERLALGTSGYVLKSNGTDVTWAAEEKQTGDVVQTVYASTGAVATGSTEIPFDDTIPQNTEGDEYLTLSITPTNASNKLEIYAEINGSLDSANSIRVALFQDSTADALAIALGAPGGSGAPLSVPLFYSMTAGTVSATTFKIRASGQSTDTFTLNGTGGARVFGGVFISKLIIREIKV